VFSKPILLAEDDADDVFMFRRHYERCGVHNPLHVVSSGEDVVKYFEASRLNYPLPALLFLDLKMPIVGGLEVLDYLKRSSQDGFTTIVLSGSQDLKMVTQAYQLGAGSFLTKPIEKQEFCDLMARFEAVKMDGCPPAEGLSASTAKAVSQPGAGPASSLLRPPLQDPAPPRLAGRGTCRGGCGFNG
jgi:two-component system response regulator